SRRFGAVRGEYGGRLVVAGLAAWPRRGLRGALGGVLGRVDRAGAQVGRDALDATELADELRRDAEVIRDRVDRFVVVTAPTVGQPSSEGGMTPGPLGLGQRAVGHLADELGLEREFPVFENH